MAELPIAEFLRERMKESDGKFEVRKGTAFDTLFFKMAQLVLQPFRDEADEMFTANSLRRVLKTDDPDAFNEELVDAVVENVYVYRFQGGRSSGVARVYYDAPVGREYAANGFVAIGANSKNYVNPAPFAVLSSQMETQIENGLYYFDIPINSEELGADTEIPEAGGLVSVNGDPDVISVTNKNPVMGGRDRETNTQLIERARKSITVRDLVTGKGSSAILFENFPSAILEMQAIGFGDKEMMRDVLYNAHVGGKHDQYIKTSRVTRKSQDFVGILIDDTRASRTSTQLMMTDSVATPSSSSGWHDLGEMSIDRGLGDPVVSQVKPYTSATMTPAPLLDTGVSVLLGEMDLSSKFNLLITLDGTERVVNVVGDIATRTKRQEIINKINKAFGYNIASSYEDRIQFTSQSSGTGSYLKITHASTNDAFDELFAGPAPLEAFGDGPIIFSEGTQYLIKNEEGEIGRVVPSPPAPPKWTSSGYLLTATGGSSTITAHPAQDFAIINVGDILVIAGASPTEIDKEYRITKKVSDLIIEVDDVFPQTAPIPDGPIDLTDKVIIVNPRIKNNEAVDVQFYFNPLSIDIGKYMKLDDLGHVRGIRPGREALTIQDVAFLRVVQIEVIDPVSGEPLDQILKSQGGFGYGGFGDGSFGYGSSSEFRMVVNDPHARFSAFEDSYLVIDSAYQGYSLRVTYDCVPEIEDIHHFCRSDYERVLDGDVLAKHFIPAFVSATIEYEADSSDSSIPDNEALTSLVKEFIDTRPAGVPLQVSDVSQFILKKIDPNYNFKGSVRPFVLYTTIHNTDGTISMLEDSTALAIPEPNPFPKYTTAPLSPRISHWVSDNIVLVRS